MRVPARFDRRSVLLWLLAAAIATALAVWDLATREPAPPPPAAAPPAEVQVDIVD